MRRRKGDTLPSRLLASPSGQIDVQCTITPLRVDNTAMAARPATPNPAAAKPASRGDSEQSQQHRGDRSGGEQAEAQNDPALGKTAAPFACPGSQPVPAADVAEVAAPGGTDQDNGRDEEDGHEKPLPAVDRPGNDHGGYRHVQAAGHQQPLDSAEAQDKLGEKHDREGQPDPQTDPGAVPLPRQFAGQKAA